MTKPDQACGRWPECGCTESCEYWSGPTIEPVGGRHGDCPWCGESSGIGQDNAEFASWLDRHVAAHHPWMNG